MESAISSSGFFSSCPLWPLTSLALVCLIVSGETLGADGRPGELPPQVVTTNSLGNESPATSSSVLEGDELILCQKGSFDEALNGLSGVSSTYFGSGVSQPAIRGMDDDRIRLLRNGVGVLDASSLSYDHAVPEGPGSVERLEVVRGSAALLCGGNAIDGVVNSSGNRIPSEPADGIRGSGELRYGGADTTHSRSGALEAGDGNLALCVDAASRKSNNVRIPDYARSSRQRQVDGDTGKHRVQNSDGRQDGSVVGGSYRWGHGYAGLFYSGYSSNYGSPVEDDMRLKVQQDRYAFASGIRDLGGPLTSLRLGAAYTKYEYKEIGDGETGTTSKNEGYEGRIETRHRPPGPLNGMAGAQFANSRFSALGEEAFVPHTEADSAALLALEEQKPDDRFDFDFGARLEHTRASPDARSNERFAENNGSQSLTTGSLSTGAVYKLTPIWSLATALSYVERAPAFCELYANGLHAATGIYEVGDTDADKERTVSTDPALHFDNGVHKGSVGVLYSRFSNYIDLPTNDHHRSERDEMVAAGDDGVLLEYLCSGIHADFYGVEAQGRIHLLESPYGNFDLKLSGDYVRAKNKDADEPLLRTAPLRLNTVLIWELQQRQARVDVEYAASRHYVSEEEFSADGYTTLGASLGCNLDLGEGRWLIFVKGTDLTNQTVRHASSTLRDRMPAVGRGTETGTKVAF